MKRLYFMPKISLVYLLISTILAAVLTSAVNIDCTLAQERIIRLGTSKEGTIGYASGVGMSACIKKYLKDISMEAVPTPGGTASVKIFDKKGADMAFTNTWTLTDAYNNSGPFENAPIGRKPLQGFYWLTADWMIIYESGRKDIKSLHDIVDKKFFPNVAGSGVYDGYRYIFSKMGIWDKMKLRQVGLTEATDALQMGTVDAIGAYSNSRLFGPPWLRELDARLNIKILVPSAEEQKFISAIPAVSCGPLSNKWMRPQNQALNPGPLWGWSVHYGFHPGSDMPSEIMYKIYRTWIEHAKTDLAGVNATLKFFAEDPIDWQLMGIEEARGIPVHPGVAKYLKEKNLWKSHWKIGKLDPGIE